MYKDFEQDRTRGDFSVLPELHSVLSGMKVCSSRVAQPPCYLLSRFQSHTVDLMSTYSHMTMTVSNCRSISFVCELLLRFESWTIACRRSQNCS